MDGDKTYLTRDLYLAAVLVTLKFQLLRTDFQIEGSNSKMVGYFVFEDTDTLRGIVSKYQQGLLEVEPRLFVTNQKMLKANVINFINNPNRA